MQFTECHKHYGVTYGKAQVNREASADKLKRSFKCSQAIESISVLSSLKGCRGKLPHRLFTAEIVIVC